MQNRKSTFSQNRISQKKNFFIFSNDRLKCFFFRGCLIWPNLQKFDRQIELNSDNFAKIMIFISYAYGLKAITEKVNQHVNA